MTTIPKEPVALDRELRAEVMRIWQSEPKTRYKCPYALKGERARLVEFLSSPDYLRRGLYCLETLEGNLLQTRSPIVKYPVISRGQPGHKQLDGLLQLIGLNIAPLALHNRVIAEQAGACNPVTQTDTGQAVVETLLINLAEYQRYGRDWLGSIRSLKYATTQISLICACNRHGLQITKEQARKFFSVKKREELAND